jgi:hypothetical protein
VFFGSTFIGCTFIGCAVIKVRYRDQNELSPGLHAATERQGRNTTVYLLSGLNAAQRRAALRRLKISARRGYGPRLPAPALALALLADRIRTALGQAGAVFRSHPAGSTVPVMMVSAGAIVFLALSPVSSQVTHQSRDPGHGSTVAAGSAAPLRAGSGSLAARWVRPQPAARTDRSGPDRAAGPARLDRRPTPKPTATQAAAGSSWRLAVERTRAFSERSWFQPRYDWKPGWDDIGR